MAEPFVKLYSWMTALGLSAAEMVCLAVIHSDTIWKGGYSGGADALAKWSGTTRRHVIRMIRDLAERGLIKVKAPSKGRNATVYASTGEPCHNVTVQDPTVTSCHGKPCHNVTHIDIIEDKNISNGKDARARDLQCILSTIIFRNERAKPFEATIRQAVTEMWEAAEITAYGEHYTQAETRELLRGMTTAKAFKVWRDYVRYANRGAVESDAGMYLKTIIMQKLKEGDTND